MSTLCLFELSYFFGVYISHWQATNYFKLRARLSINLPSRKRKSSYK